MLLVYDGECGFCTSCAHWYAKRARDPSRIAPYQSLDLGALGLTTSQAASALHWSAGDRLFRGADACAAALRSLSGAWRVLGHLMAVPGIIHLARLIYRLVAANRQRLPGATPG